MKAYDPADIRNVALIGHGGVGKTSIAEAMLHVSGMTDRLGKVDQGNTTTDFTDEEIERKISIGTAVCHVEADGVKTNVLDCPGFSNFIPDARVALRVAEGAVVVVCGVSGVEVQTEKSWGFANEFGVARIVAVNRLDRDRASFDRALESLQSSFGREVVPIQLPIGAEAEFKGVVDLLSGKAYVYAGDESGKFEQTDAPADMADAISEKREALVEMIAESDEELLEKYLEEAELSDEDAARGLANAVAGGKVVPVVCTSATANIGTHQLLGAIRDLLPSPAAAGELTTLDSDGNENTQAVDPAGPFSAYVFKTLADPYAGRISLFRVFTGTVKTDDTVVNVGRSSQERLNGLSVLQGKTTSAAAELRAGDFGAIAKLKDTMTGDTLADKSFPQRYPPVTSPEPSVSFAVTAKSRGDEDKMGTALGRIIEEDPTLRFGRDERTGEQLLSGMGERHIDVVVARLKKQFGVEVELKTPRVPYLETVRGTAEVTYRHKKQSGGSGQFGECKIRLEPAVRGDGFEFIDKIFGGSIPQNLRPAVEKGVVETAARGHLAGYPVIDFKVTLLDGKTHPVDSNEMAFKIAGSQAFKQAVEQAKLTLLEPIMDAEITGPDELMGDLIGDLNSRRGRVQNTATSGSNVIITAQVPMSEMLSYSAIIKSITGGRGDFTMAFSHYEEVPPMNQKKIIEEAQAQREEAGS